MSTMLVWAAAAVGGVLVTGALFWIAAKVVRVQSAGLGGRAMLSAVFCAIVAAAVLASICILTSYGRAGCTFQVRWLAGLLAMIVCVAVLKTGLEATFAKALAVWCGALGMAAVLAMVALPGIVYACAYLGLGTPGECLSLLDTPR